MNVFSYLPTPSFSFRPTYLLEEGAPSSSGAVVWKNSAFKIVDIPLDFTNALLNKRRHQSSLGSVPTDTNGKEWDSTAISPLARPPSHNNNNLPHPATTMTPCSVMELRRQGATTISKPTSLFYRKYPIFDRHHHHHHHRHAHSHSHQAPASPHCYVHPPECNAADQSKCRASGGGGNELASLKALCDTDVSVLMSKRPIVSLKDNENGGENGQEEDESSHGTRQLKFGMERILSDAFGKGDKQDIGKENNTLRGVSGPPFPPSHTLCPCINPPCSSHGKQPRDVLMYSPNQLPSLSAVQALHTPRYPFTSSADSLPGPYSVLSTDAYSSSQNKRKRSWSRAVFSNLQRKGLEKRFEVQKYVTKLDRRQLANMLGLTDAQVKVWFQNRRMKWRHAQQQKGKDKETKQDEQEVVDVGETDPPEEEINSGGSELLNETADIVIEDNDQDAVDSSV